jgi:hypothetical protein
MGRRNPVGNQYLENVKVVRTLSTPQAKMQQTWSLSSEVGSQSGFAQDRLQGQQIVMTERASRTI